MSIQIRTVRKDTLIKIKVLIQHPMTATEQFDFKTNQRTPARYITELTVKQNDEIIASGHLSANLSRNPYFEFRCMGERGDQIEISYIDSSGLSSLGRAMVT